MSAEPIRLRVLAGAMVAGLFLLGVARAVPDKHYSGTLTTVSADQLVMTVDEESITFVVNGSTMISLDGKPASTSDLMAGDTARVMAAQQGEDGTRVALRIDAERDE